MNKKHSFIVSFLVASSLFPCAGITSAHELTSWSDKMELARTLAEKSQHKESMSALIEAYKDLNGIEHARDSHKKEFVDTLTELADSYHKAGDWPSEYQVLIILGAFYRYHQNTDSIEYADCLWKIGINCDHRKAYEEGLANLKQAAEIYKDHPLISAERISRIDRGLGHLYSETGQFTLARESLSSAEKLSEKLLNERVHDLVRALILKGRLDRKLKEYDRAIVSYKKAIELFRNHFRRGHLWLGQAFNEYCDLLEERISAGHNQKRDQKIEVDRKIELVKALALSQLLNNSYYDAKTTLIKLKALYEAENLTKRRDYVLCLENLGECCSLLGDFEDGLQFQRKAVQIYETLEHDKAAYASALLRLAFYENKSLSEKEKALATLNQTKKIITEIHGADSSNFAHCLELELSWLQDSFDQEKAKEILTKLKSIDPDLKIPQNLRDKKELNKFLHSLNRMKNERYHERLWRQWHSTFN